MNFMKPMKHFSGCQDGCERNISFFSFCMAKGAFFASLLCIKFINFDTRNVISAISVQLMNFMKLYEEGKIKGFFGDAFIIVSGFMNLAGHPFFIHVHKCFMTAYPTLSFNSPAYGCSIGRWECSD